MTYLGSSLSQSQEDCQPDLPSEVPRHSNQGLNISDFMHDWSRGLPVVITDVLLQGTWDPQYFIDAYGEVGATIVNCETGETRKVKVREYFERFLNPGEFTGIWKLKVRHILCFPGVILKNFYHRIPCSGLASPARFSGLVSRTIRCLFWRCS
jgi:hypothetical protein